MNFIQWRTGPPQYGVKWEDAKWEFFNGLFSFNLEDEMMLDKATMAEVKAYTIEAEKEEPTMTYMSKSIVSYWKITEEDEQKFKVECSKFFSRLMGLNNIEDEKVLELG